jgi:plasmid stabilization system protein ParE
MIVARHIVELTEHDAAQHVDDAIEHLNESERDTSRGGRDNGSNLGQCKHRNEAVRHGHERHLDVRIDVRIQHYSVCNDCEHLYRKRRCKVINQAFALRYTQTYPSQGADEQTLP